MGGAPGASLWPQPFVCGLRGFGKMAGGHKEEQHWEEKENISP